MALEIATAVVMLAGTFFMVVTGVGLVRFPDVYTRMHAAGKAGTAGVALLILAPSIYFAPSEPFDRAVVDDPRIRPFADDAVGQFGEAHQRGRETVQVVSKPPLTL